MLGIVILNYNNWKLTINCINNINEIYNEPYNIYIIDNNSKDDSYRILKETFNQSKNIFIYNTGCNGGFSYGNNFGLKKAYQDNCDLILCTNNDVIFKENSINIMESKLLENDDVAIVGPQVLLQNGNRQECTRKQMKYGNYIISKKPFIYFDFLGLSKKFKYNKYNYKDDLLVEGMVSGCCFMIKAKDLYDINFLDENIFLYHEEDIIGSKIRHINKKILLVPSSIIIHLGGASTGKNNAFLRYINIESSLYYFKNYYKYNSIAYNFIVLFQYINFKIYSLKNKEYKQYAKKILKTAKEIKSNEFKNEHIKDNL